MIENLKQWLDYKKEDAEQESTSVEFEISTSFDCAVKQYLENPSLTTKSILDSAIKCN